MHNTKQPHSQLNNTHPFNGPLSRTTQVSRYQKCNTNLDFTEARDSESQWHWIILNQETVSGSGISWAVCKTAPRSRQITMPAPHHSVFYRPDALPRLQCFDNSVKALKAQLNNEQHKQASASGLQKQMSVLSYGPFGTGRTLHIAFYAFKRLPTESFTEYLARCSETV